MWIKHLFLGFIGLASGVGVAAGTFAFIIVIGVVPRMIAKCNRAENTILFENMIVLGGLLKIAPIVTLENVIKGLKKTLPERHHHLIPMNEEAIKRGMELIKEV